MIELKEKISLPAHRKRTVWLQIGTLLDGVSSKPLHNAHVVYNVDEILFVGKENSSPPPHFLNPEQTEPDLHLPNYTLLPGLIEAHAHLFLDGSELDIAKRKAQLTLPSQKMLQLSQPRLEKLLQFGIIAVRDAGDKFGVGLALSKQYQKVTSTFTVESLPYIDSPAAAINHKGGYGGFMAEPIENFSSLQECIESRITAGAERIKIIATDIIDFKKGNVLKAPQMTLEEISEIVQIAKAHHRQTFAHASGDEGIERTIAGNVDSIEHGFFVRDDQLAKMRDHNIAWCPTFTPLQKQIDYADKLGWNEKTISYLKRILDQHSTSLLKAYQLGVTIIAGSDAGSYGVLHGTGLLDEMELMEQAGLSSLAVINSATGNSSNRLAFREKFGQIKPEYKSRFILTEHSLLKNISNLRKEKYVVFDGTVIKSNY